MINGKKEQRNMIMEINGNHSRWNETELEIAEFMTKIREINPEVERVRKPSFNLNWGAQKIIRYRTRRNSSACTTLAVVKTPEMMTTAASTSGQEAVSKVAAPVTSPNTPLCFSQSSESEDNSSSDSRYKRKRDELKRTVEELTGLQKRLKKELDCVSGYHHKLMAYNKSLKEEKKLALAAHSKTHEQGEKYNLEVRNNFNLRSESSDQLYQTAVIRPPPPPQQSQLMLIPQPMTISETLPHPSGPTLKFNFHYQKPSPIVGPAVNHGGPIWSNNGVLKQERSVGLPQCNAPMDYARLIAHCQARAQAAEARKLRRMAVKNKSCR
ncbi:OLC1v1018235C1 [Oldenlandia corymbosa var. corymbosa]|uniref:OLC1v1018235C1 n=1 Tax=Oldenlandia corymbosa var. corymbosa TaxID=529605 RepID=A0AAV1EB69_OLDCO|nr:OLC1v1018235C1 [Oldenlandia corymbosa var. corymbosa]